MERGVKTTLDHRQGKSPLKEASPSPSKGGDVFVGYSLKQLEICERIKDIPSLGGAWGGFLLGGFLFIYHGSILRLIQGINRSVIRQLDYINCEINVFQN